MIRFVAALVVLFLLTACGDRSTRLVIENQSTVKLESVSAEGSGFKAYVGDLNPGERADLKIYPSGEAGIGIYFSTNGKSVSTPQTGYFEAGGGDRVDVTISPDLKVSVKETTWLD